MTFKEAYKGPFHHDIPYIRCVDNNMAFTVLTEDEKLLDDICEKLNGNSTITIPNLTIDDCYICVNNKRILMVRGWGYLTGIGGLNLNPQEASKIQDDFLQWTFETLSTKIIFK